MVHPQPIYLILNDIRSLYNVGSMFRSADAFGVKKVYLCGYTGTPPRGMIAKTALGAEMVVPWEHVESIVDVIEKLKNEGIRVVALELSSQSLNLRNYIPQAPTALVVGNEVEGLAGDVLSRCDDVVAITMHGAKESLNVACATAVALYQLSCTIS